MADKGDTNDICEGADWVELFNKNSASAANLAGLVLADDKGHGHEDAFELGQAAYGCPTDIPAGGYLVCCPLLSVVHGRGDTFLFA